MSEGAARPSSPSPSVSLLEVKEETRLVLKSFLRNVVSVPPAERPGRVGGTYHDSKKYSAEARTEKKVDSGWDSRDEAISTAEEKKHRIKSLIKRRLRPRSITHPDAQHKGASLERDRKPGLSENGQPATLPKILQKKLEPEDLGSSSSFSEDEGEKKQGEDGKKKMKKKKSKSKSKIQLPSIFRKSKKDEPPQRPSALPVSQGPATSDQQLSPTHPPEFYVGVADSLERIARKSVKKSKPVPPPISPPQSQPADSAKNKNDIVEQLVQILCTEGDLINEKMKGSPFLRKSLDRMSYPSFAKLLDTYASQTQPATPPPVPASPTLRKVAITMEASRRVVTASGAHQRMKEYTERYMENFAPWVKEQGGWESIADEIHEYD